MKTDHFYPELGEQDVGQPLQLDIYVPSHKIAFEFQGVQHYNTSLFAGKVQRGGVPKERSKKDVCKSIGITLVEVYHPHTIFYSLINFTLPFFHIGSILVGQNN